MYKQLVEKFLSKESNVADYREAVRLLRKCGLLDILRRGGFPSVINNGSDLNAMAHEGSWSNGYQTGINQLEHLEEFYANKNDTDKARRLPTFGGSAIATREGYLTKDEVKTLGDKK